MKLLVVLMVWLGCLAPYLASKQNRLSQSHLPKSLAWVFFSVLQIAAVSLLQAPYGFASANLIVLTLLMCMWPVLVFSAPYFKQRTLLLSSVALSIFALISATGNFHGL